MIRKTLATALFAAVLMPAGVMAQQAPVAVAASTYSISNTTIGALLDDLAAKAILDKYLPGLSTNAQIAMARGMTLKAVQPFAADKITDEVLAKIDADLAKLSLKK